MIMTDTVFAAPRPAIATRTATIARRFEPAALAAALDARLFFARTGQSAIVALSTALDIEATAERAVLRPNNATGAIFADLLAMKFASYRSNGGPEYAFTFPRCSSPFEDERASAVTAIDLLEAGVRLGGEAEGGNASPPLIALGVLSFDHVDMFEPLPAMPESDFPDLGFSLLDAYARFDEDGAATIVALAAGSDADARAEAKLAEILAKIDACDPAASHTAAPSPCEAVAQPDDAGFADVVRRMKAHIAAGDIFQAVPSRRFTAPCHDGAGAFARLIARDPAAYHYRFVTRAGELIGASPETAVEIRRDGGARKIIVRPIAGTRPRADDPATDQAHMIDLLQDEKELAEHMMLVDLARNDVARVARPGTRQVSRLLDVVRFADVMHLESTVEGEIDDAVSLSSAIRACLNVGTLSGAPKLRATELIRDMEGGRRGPYGGAVGFVCGDGTMDLAVVIRSALIRDGVAEVRAGAGIVADSDPASEVAETSAKASAMLRALGAVS